VVAGLAAWRKPHIFFGGKAAPEMTTRDFSVPAPGAAPAAETAKPAAQTAAAPASPPAQTAPAQQAPTPAAPAQTRPTVHETASLPVPMPGQPVTSVPQDPAAATPEAPVAKEPVSPEIVSQHPLFAGDQNLDKMFAEMGADAAASKVNTSKKPAPLPPQAPAPTPAESAVRPVAPEPAAVPAESLDITDAKPALITKKPIKDKPAAAPKTPAATSRGTVVAVSAADKPGEYVLSVTTSAPVGDVTRVYMDDPPRLIIDLAGRWTYTGALSLPGKSPLIRQVRVGKHPDRLRLVLDLAPEAVTRLREAPMVDRNPNGVVIRLPK
jgi:hypothetical protein